MLNTSTWYCKWSVCERVSMYRQHFLSKLNSLKLCEACLQNKFASISRPLLVSLAQWGLTCYELRKPEGFDINEGNIVVLLFIRREQVIGETQLKQSKIFTYYKIKR